MALQEPLHHVILQYHLPFSMNVFLIADPSKAENYPAKGFFNEVLWVDDNEKLLYNILNPSNRFSAILEHTGLALIDTESSHSFALISLMVRSGVHVLSPNLIHFEIEELKELQAIASEIGVQLGYIPHKSVNINQNITSPCICHCEHRFSGLVTLSRLNDVLLSDLTIILKFINEAIRKIKVYWIPVYCSQPKVVTIVVDFNDNSVLTYQAIGNSLNSFFKAETITETSLFAFETNEGLQESTFPSTEINHFIDKFINHQKMEYPVDILLKSKTIQEFVKKKIWG